MRARARYGRMTALAGAAVAAATLTTVALAPASASAAPAPKSFDLAKDGKIVAKGAAVKLSFAYTCPAGWQGGASVTVVEALGDAFASGYGGKNLKCTGGQQNATFFIQANTYDGARPFQAGEASLVASLDAWNPEDGGGGCGPGMPCPLPTEGDAPATAAPPHGYQDSGYQDSSYQASSIDTPVKEPASLHREFTGVVKLS